MREVIIHKDDKTTVTIKSPWLDIALASSYLGISRSEFLKVVGNNVPFKGFGNRRRYHVDNLDKFNPQPEGCPRPQEPAKGEVITEIATGGCP